MKKFFCYGKKDFCENTDLCIDCPHFACAGGEYQEAPMTNADRIRAMSDEEIAESSAFRFCPSEMIGESCAFRKCKECWLEWLQMPAEEDDHVV